MGSKLRKFWESRDAWVYPLEQNKKGSYKCLVLDAGAGDRKPKLRNVEDRDLGEFYVSKGMTDAAIVELFMDHPRFEA